MKTLILILTVAASAAGVYSYNAYPRANARIVSQVNVGPREMKMAVMRYDGQCQYLLITEITDGYNVACVNVYAGE